MPQAQGANPPQDPREDAELASLHGVLDEVGATYPLLAYVGGYDDEDYGEEEIYEDDYGQEAYDEESAVDSLIFEGLIRP